MRSRFSIIFIILLMIAAIGFDWVTLKQHEPNYQGHALSFWLAPARQNNWVDAEAESAIRAMGDKAVPYFIKMVEVRDSALRQEVIALSIRQDWVSMPIRSQHDLQMSAFFGFRSLGAAAQPAVLG